MRILHVASVQEWRVAQVDGRYTTSSRAATLADEGFIHASTSKQAPGVLASFYTGLDPAELCLLVVDIEACDTLGSPVRWDPVPGRPAPFPHIYGPIVPAAVVAVLPLAGVRDALELPDLTGLDVAADEPAQ